MARELFEREARTLGQIGNHPQVPRLLDYFEDSDQFYLVQEYISGLTLQQDIKENGPMSEAGVKQFLSEILPLLRDIHKQNVIHRDIKPANIIRREQDRKLVLIDFGAVKNQVNQDLNNSEQTALTNFAIGTPGFAPPEQMELRPVFASDIYAVGVTCIYLLTGKSPKDLEYNPLTGEMVWRKHVQISDDFAEVLKKMLESTVRYRFKTADEVITVLNLGPYIDSLREGLTIKPNHPPNSSSRNLFSEELNIPSSPSNPSSPTSATEKLAAQIRARRERQARSGSPYTSGGQGQGNTGIPGQRATATSLRGDSNTIGRPRTPAKMDSNAVLTAYLKGRKDFASLDLSNLDLQKANLSGGIFHQSKVSRTNLQGSDLTGVDFGRASLVKANLRDAILARAYCSYTDFEGADLRGADLSYSNLSNANFKGANLCGTNLTGAKITKEQLAQAKTNWSTVLPSGKRGFW
jgi:serine/threonine-protein kinase